jgi:predicted TIM-barrel fold metal-dependent hydrolase
MIDGHIHVGRWSERFFGLDVSLPEVDRVLADCGIEGAAVTATDLRDNESLLHQIRDARLRYWFFPWVNPAEDADLGRLEGWGKAVAGLKFHPSCDGVRITDPRCGPYLEYAGRLKLPVLVHCGRWQEMSSYRYALEAASRYPDIRFVFAHMGGDQPDLVRATYEALGPSGPGNVWLGMEGIREYWLIREAIDSVGPARVIWGSDFPIGHPKMYLGLLEALALDEEEYRWVTRESFLSAVSG